MSDRSTRDTELERLAARFVGAFEHVFGADWDHTRACLRTPEIYVDPALTFINPGQFDEADNWCSRLGLLEAYRCLAEELLKRGVVDPADEEE